DFPNHSPWMDWAKYTDEGWYGDAAIRHFQRGHWNVPGDFNPAAALPVWPLLEAAFFRFTGVNLAAARALTVAIFACILFTSYFSWSSPRPPPSFSFPPSSGSSGRAPDTASALSFVSACPPPRSPLPSGSAIISSSSVLASFPTSTTSSTPTVTQASPPPMSS